MQLLSWTFKSGVSAAVETQIDTDGTPHCLHSVYSLVIPGG